MRRGMLSSIPSSRASAPSHCAPMRPTLFPPSSSRSRAASRDAPEAMLLLSARVTSNASAPPRDNQAERGMRREDRYHQANRPHSTSITGTNQRAGRLTGGGKSRNTVPQEIPTSTANTVNVASAERPAKKLAMLHQL